MLYLYMLLQPDPFYLLAPTSGPVKLAELAGSRRTGFPPNKTFQHQLPPQPAAQHGNQEQQAPAEQPQSHAISTRYASITDRTTPVG